MPTGLHIVTNMQARNLMLIFLSTLCHCEAELSNLLRAVGTDSAQLKLKEI